MGVSERKFSNFIIDFQKQYRRKLALIADLMPKDFKDGYFIEVFQKAYPSMWLNLERHYEAYQEKNSRLSKDKYDFPKPHIFIIKTSKHILSKVRKTHLAPDYIKNKNYKQEIQIFIEQNSQKYNKTFEDQDILRQHVKVPYLKELEEQYFSVQSIDAKTEIFNELIKYNNKIVITILHKINNREYNPYLKNRAFQTLQEMGEVVFLRKNKKGKNKYKNIYPDKSIFNKTPESLLIELHKSSIQKFKNYDIFLSHSYNDLEEIIKFTKLLNSLGLVVYVDWISDKEGLKRNLVSHHTVNVIKERIKNSKVLIYFNTMNTNKSFWIPWELGYFDGLEKKIAIYHTKNSETNEILDSYPSIIEKNHQLYTGGDLLDFDKWINNK